MKDITLEFGLLIAYAIPGAFALFGVAAYIPELQTLLSMPDDKKWISTALLLAGLSIVLGMLVSVLRAITIDRSFLIRFTNAETARPQWGKIKRVEPDYSAMRSKDALAALQDVRSTDKRPYQFYGNILVALTILEFSRYAQGKVNIAEGVIAITAAIAFYTASRSSHFRYMQAVIALNTREERNSLN